MKNKKWLAAVKKQLTFLKNVTLRNSRFNFRITQGKNKKKDIRIIGMMRLRNEELILQDSLDHLSQFVDGIIIFDDASTDKSVAVAKNHPAVLEVIENKKWRQFERAWEETANRSYLYKRAKRYWPEWFFYADADERFEGDIKEYLHHCPKDVAAIKVSLFDAYITSHDKEAYRGDQPLYNYRKYFGIEQRDIIMLWRNLPGIHFKRADLREPQGVDGKIVTKFYCQHFGKSISIAQWEETCKYYAENFPKYSQKWNARRGKAVHVLSDFGTKLYEWNEVKKRGIVIN